jgi:hypothetical protein
MSTATFWNGEPCQATRGVGTVADAPEFPLYWARSMVGERVPVVQVTYGEQRFTLYDEGSAAWRALTIGRGSPRWLKSSLTVTDFAAADPDETR